MSFGRTFRWTVGLLLLAAGLSGCDGGRPEKGSDLRILFTGETVGDLEPCNCSGKMAGGLPVRAGYIAAQKKGFLLLDVGCLGHGTRDFEVLRARAALRGMKEMGYDAVNVAEHELWIGRQGLRQLMEEGVPFVSANVMDSDDKPVAMRYLLLKRNGLSVAVTGIVDHQRYQPGDGLSVRPAHEVLARLIPELRDKAGVLVVLADLDPADVRQLALDFPEITVILFRGRGDSHAPELVNRTVIASIYGEARYIGDMTVTWESRTRTSARGEAVLLDERFAPSLGVIETTIQWYKDAIRGREFDLALQSSGWEKIQPTRAEPGNAYVGSDTCMRCHPYQYARWKVQRHANAMESLKKAGYEWSPECIVCHTVGYGSPDGYVSMEKTPAFGRVGCENCHGRGKILEHGSCKGLARKPTEDTCRGCHTLSKHAEFQYQKQWAIINHKEKR